MHAIRQHLSYANVAATLALVFAMGGSAIAANHYLINSTKQINPKVLKKLKGRSGHRGPSGAPGAKGAAGVAGGTGSQGPRGPEGSAGLSALSTLPSGATESGGYAASGNVNKVGATLLAGVSFAMALRETIPASNIVYTTATEPVTHCSGVRQADPGFLCIYSFSRLLVSEPPEVFAGEDAASTSSGLLGFKMLWKSTSAGFAFDDGSYAVTAP
jgi:hypothetical protein